MHIRRQSREGWRVVGQVLAGIDIGGTKTHVIICSQDYHVIGRAAAPTPAMEGGAAMVNVAGELIQSLLAHTDGTLQGIGLGAAGVVDRHEGKIAVASDSFRDWAGFHVTEALSKRFGVPSFLDNDVNAFLRGEIAVGSMRGMDNVLAIMLGTGVGGALWMNGTVFEGPYGGAGEIGHIPGFGDEPCSCGGYGHFEAVASGRSVVRRYHACAPGHDTVYDAQQVAELARDGDTAALRVFQDAGRAIARAISIAAGLVDVRTVVIGGGLSLAWDLLGPSMDEEVESNPPIGAQRIIVTVSELGPDAVALGAASMIPRSISYETVGQPSNRQR